MKSNRTPFSDVCELVVVTISKDADGYDVNTETKAQVFCSVNTGAVRSEFYEALKAGVKLSITVEVWQDDYNNATMLDFDEKRYKIERVYPTGHGTLELTCSEVV
jgi:hypothetical protein